MNRKIELSERIKKSIIEITDKMSKDDKVAFYQAINDGDIGSEYKLLEKYHYTKVTPIEEVMSDEDAEAMAGAILKNADVYKEVKNILISSGEEYWSKQGRMNAIPLENYEEIINEAMALQSSFKTKDDINAILYGHYGENTATIVKAAMIADLIGCLDLRNDLLVLFGSMIDNAHNSKAISLYEKKKVIREDRSKAGKGNTSRHKETALKIAKDTWEKYPNASQNGMAEELFSYFRGKWKDNPGTKAITGWLAASGMNPDCKPKSRKFDLIINE